MHRHIHTLLGAALLMTSTWANGAGPAPTVEPQLLQVALVLVSEYPSADPMVVEHAHDLIAGKPTKSWKTCLLEKTLLQAQVIHKRSVLVVADTPVQ